LGGTRCPRSRPHQFVESPISFFFLLDNKSDRFSNASNILDLTGLPLAYCLGVGTVLR
jgi:hypothetical protein